ncbi:imidazole glycerol phosphate synthase subunit HisH [Magnetovibrio sp.]|uniref:imidazole glycerol phosphate synthase subunit HisH n=1 Tax=Magnetovibrio sp. TaxID=2024836 RepID=UPI002F952DA6
MKVAIIDYGSGNLRSAAKSFERAAGEQALNADIVVTGNPDDLRGADRIVLPGVGAFADCKAGLEAVDGLHDALNEAVIEKGRPFLGICVGMQLMSDVGHEFGDTPGLGWIAGDVTALTPTDAMLKIPHMGWNDLRILTPHPVFDGIANGEHAYFVHSFQFKTKDPAHVLAQVEYGGPVTAAVGRDNMIGTQFHPEKSQALGLHFIANFLKWAP